MGQARQRKLRGEKPLPYPRTREQVEAHFADRLSALHSLPLPAGGFDAAKATHTVDDEGNTVIPMTPEVEATMRLQLDMFKYKFGRKPGPTEPRVF